MTDDKSTGPVRPYLLSPARTLRDACRQTGRDIDGARCPVCPVRDLCESDERWLVALTSRSRPVQHVTGGDGRGSDHPQSSDGNCRVFKHDGA